MIKQYTEELIVEDKKYFINIETTKQTLFDAYGIVHVLSPYVEFEVPAGGFLPKGKIIHEYTNRPEIVDAYNKLISKRDNK